MTAQHKYILTRWISGCKYVEHTSYLILLIHFLSISLLPLPLPLVSFSPQLLLLLSLLHQLLSFRLTSRKCWILSEEEEDVCRDSRPLSSSSSFPSTALLLLFSSPFPVSPKEKIDINEKYNWQTSVLPFLLNTIKQHMPIPCSGRRDSRSYPYTHIKHSSS